MLSAAVLVEATILVFLGAVAMVRCIQPKGIVSTLLAIFTWSISQIVLSLLLAGQVLQLLFPSTVLLINIIITVVLFLLSLRYGKPLSMQGSVRYFRAVGEAIREALSTSWAGALAVLALAVTGWITFLGVLYPPFAYDELAYHLVSPAHWVQAGRIFIVPDVIWSNVYPADMELCYTWLMLFTHSDRFVHLGQIIFAVAGAIAVMGIGREVGLRRSSSVAAGCLFLLTPIVVAQMSTALVDVAHAAMFLVFFYFIFRYLREPRLFNLVFGGLSAGLTIGIKSTGVLEVGLVLLLIPGVFLYRRYSRHIPEELRSARLFSLGVLGRFAGGTAILGVPILILGGFWYLRTWVYYGNPIYPFTVKIAGHTIFPGWGSVQDVIMAPLIPPQLVGRPAWQQLLISWLKEPPLGIDYRGLGFYIYDERLGGLGPQWTFLIVPILLGFVVYILIRRRYLFFTLVLPFALIFILLPASWWSRYSLYIVAPGAIALAYVLEHTRPWWMRGSVKTYSLLLVLLSLYFSATQGPYFSGNKVIATLRMPSYQRTIGAIWMPEYRWVDQVGPGAHIATVGWTPHHYAIFALYGDHIQNQVVILTAQDRTSFLEHLQSSGAQYLFTETGADYANWADSDPAHFHLIDTTGANRVYKINWQGFSASAPNTNTTLGLIAASRGHPLMW